MADRKKTEWVKTAENHRRRRGWEISDVLILQIPGLPGAPKYKKDQPTIDEASGK